jgi:hypothetical protein
LVASANNQVENAASRRHWQRPERANKPPVPCPPPCSCRGKSDKRAPRAGPATVRRYPRPPQRRPAARGRPRLHRRQPPWRTSIPR